MIVHKTPKVSTTLTIFSFTSKVLGKDRGRKVAKTVLIFRWFDYSINDIFSMTESILGTVVLRTECRMERRENWVGT